MFDKQLQKKCINKTQQKILLPSFILIELLCHLKTIWLYDYFLNVKKILFTTPQSKLSASRAKEQLHIDMPREDSVILR